MQHVENPYGFLKVFGRELGTNMGVFVFMLTMFWVSNQYMVDMAVKHPFMFPNLVGYDFVMSLTLFWLWTTMHHNALLFCDELAHCLFRRERHVSLFG